MMVAAASARTTWPISISPSLAPARPASPSPAMPRAAASRCCSSIGTIFPPAPHSAPTCWCGARSSTRSGAIAAWRAALAEREVMLATAPHLARAQRIVLLPQESNRSALALRGRLFACDHLAKRRILPASQTLDLTHHPFGTALRRHFDFGFAYSDCRIDEVRLPRRQCARSRRPRRRRLHADALCTRNGARSGRSWSTHAGNAERHRARARQCGRRVGERGRREALQSSRHSRSAASRRATSSPGGHSTMTAAICCPTGTWAVMCSRCRSRAIPC